MLNNKLAGRTICVGGPHAARGPPVGQPCVTSSRIEKMNYILLYYILGKQTNKQKKDY